MATFQNIKLDPYGIVSDTDPLDVDKEWTAGQNMRFNNSASEKFGGVQEATSTPVQAYELQFNGNHISPLWVYMGDAAVHATDFTTDTNINSNNILTAGAVNWTSSLFNNFPVMNNEVDAPVYWDNVISNPIASLPAFPAQTVCKSVRPYRGFLVAMNLTESSVQQENRILWSDLSDNGALPASWDVADPTTLAGDNYLTQDKGEIIDGLTLRDFFVIYKTHSMVIMRLVGGQGVMSFQKSQVNSGVLAKNCIQEFNGKHFVVTDADVILFDGQNIKSIADKRVRARIFTDIDVDNYRNSYTVRYDRQDEMWFCYPTAGQTVPNQAAIWNWKDNTWTFRDLQAGYHIATGLANFSISDTYDEALYTYDSPEAAVAYLPIASNPTTDTLIQASTLRLGIMDEGNDDFGTTLRTTLEKTSMDFGDPSAIKYVNSITPQLSGISSTTPLSIGVQVGTQMYPSDPIVWTQIQFITPNTVNGLTIPLEAFFSVKGRYISVRFTNSEPGQTWTLNGFDINLGQQGSRY